MFSQNIVGTTCIRCQLQITLPCKFVQQVGFDIDIAVVFDLLSQNKADTPDSTVHAFDIAVGSSVGSVADAIYSSHRKLCLWFEEKTLMIIKTLSVFHTYTVDMVLVVSFVRITAIRFQIRCKTAVTGCDVGIGAAIPLPDTI